MRRPLNQLHDGAAHCDESVAAMACGRCPTPSIVRRYGRVYSGRIKAGNRVRVLGEAYSPEDPEDQRPCIVQGVGVCHGRHVTEVLEAGPGNCVVLEGVGQHVAKTATIVDDSSDDPCAIFEPPRFDDQAIVKLAVEPLNPAELPKMTEGLRKISKSYPLARTKVEESGEHVVVGTGELYLDCAMCYSASLAVFDSNHVCSTAPRECVPPSRHTTAASHPRAGTTSARCTRPSKLRSPIRSSLFVRPSSRRPH